MTHIQFQGIFLMLVSFATAAFSQDLKQNGMKQTHKVVCRLQKEIPLHSLR